MKKSIIFCMCYFCILFIPVMTMNIKKNTVSVIDNTYLPEFDLDIRNLDKISHYVEKRIGGRNKLILWYEVFNDKVFNILVHPNYTYGKNKWIYVNSKEYREDYMKINIDKEYVNEFVKYLTKLQDITERREAQFLYVLCVDKKTIYPEYFIEGVNQSNNTSRTDILLDVLSQTDINFYCARDTLLDAKERGVQVYNQKYDAGHWNEEGAFLVCQKIFNKLHQKNSNVPKLLKEDFEITTKIEDVLIASEFSIKEAVPLYINKTSNAVICSEYEEVLPGKNIFFEYYKNDMVETPKILILRDSYLGMSSKFFVENFSEVYFASYSNITSLADFETYMDLLNPDIVLFENVERTFPLEIPK